MDKNAIKRFAVWARRELISRVTQRAAQFEITEEKITDASADSVRGRVLSSAEKRQRQALIARIKVKDFKQVMEEIAYTWFNRFIALRFMEVNQYLPSHVRVFTDDEGAFRPQILSEAIDLELDGLDKGKVYALKTANDDDALFKYLIIVQCNALSEILPGMFQRIEDYTELLFPDNLLRAGSVIEQMVTSIPEEDWTDQVQIIGWLYQYYNTEPKDQVFADLKKNIKITKEKIPAATQLFTPDWIVRYMVENSLGRLWVEGHPAAKEKFLPEHNEDGSVCVKEGRWNYYLEEAEQEPEVQAKLEEIRKGYAAMTPEQLRVIDPCCGSGHILVYLFDVLVQIYEDYGYTAREAASSIIRHNLWGLDIDERAAQLSYFSVMMKARQYDRRFFSRGLQPHVIAIAESNNPDREAVDYFCKGDGGLKKAMKTVIAELHDAKEYGSILTCTRQDWDALYERFGAVYDEISLHREDALALLPLIRTAEALSQQYDVVVTNPPYMGSSGMSAKLSDFVKKNYPDSKSDLFAVFIERGNALARKDGINCMVTMQSWMFLSSFEKMRQRIINQCSITTLLHMENGVMGIAFGTAVSVLRQREIPQYICQFNQIKLEDIVDGIPLMFPISGNRNANTSTIHFKQIPGTPVAYWVSEGVYRAFTYPKLEQFTISDGQNITGNNELFLRSFWEIDSHSVGKGKKWVLCARGGAYRKWYGNIEEVINWSPSARNFYRSDIIARIIPEYLWFKTGLSWSRITSYKPSFRVLSDEWLFEKTGVSLFLKSDSQRLYIIGFLNSIVAEYLLRVITQVVSIQVRDIRSLPYIPDKIESTPQVKQLVLRNIGISKDDWDSFETSWDFRQHPLVALKGSAVYAATPMEKWPSTVRQAYKNWEAIAEARFDQLKANEEELNRIFIDIYGLQDELTPEVEDKDVTVRKADLQRDIKSLISYAVGCMFGRYSLDEPGLILAGYDRVEYSEGVRDGNDPELVKYGIDKPGSLYAYISDKRWVNQERFKSFNIDVDNVIPICDDEYFEDDIVGRFVKFIEVVYGKDTLEENLRFIADALGGKGSPRDVIRSYFLNDFYPDHLKIYQKRPIYWLFDSGKKNGFKCLIYMHRYQPDTIARIRTDYVHEQQSRYRTAIADLEARMAAASTAERVKLNKQLQKLRDQAEELRVYEEKIHHLADQMIPIDLDDGVKVNYAKFQDVLAKIK